MSEKPASKRPIKEYVRIYITGLIMGAADVVPGVSGGTMAFILGVYEELLESIRRFTSPEAIRIALTFNVKKAWNTLPWPFLLTLGLGVVTAFLSLVSIIKHMLETQPIYIWGFFFGLVAASIITVVNRVRKWNVAAIFAALVGTAAGWIVVGLPLLQNPPDSLFYIGICGACAICAMILPGISGAFILLLMGKYYVMLNALDELKSFTNVGPNLVLVIVFIVGIVIGLSLFVRGLGWLLKHHHDLSVALLIGFMIGSLRKVWPWKTSLADDAENIIPRTFDAQFWTAIGLIAAGFVIVIVLEGIAKHLEKQAAAKKTKDA